MRSPEWIVLLGLLCGVIAHGAGSGEAPSLFDSAGVYPDSIAAPAGSWSFLITRVDPKEVVPRLMVDGTPWDTGEVTFSDGDAVVVSFDYPEIPRSSSVAIEVNRGTAVQLEPAYQAGRRSDVASSVTFITVPGVINLPPLPLDVSLYSYVGPAPDTTNCRSGELLRLFHLLGVTSISKLSAFSADGDSAFYAPERGEWIPIPASNRYWYAATTSNVEPVAAASILERSEVIVSAGASGRGRFE